MRLQHVLHELLKYAEELPHSTNKQIQGRWATHHSKEILDLLNKIKGELDRIHYEEVD